VSDKPWWRRAGGLPPSVERRQRRVLTTVEVWAFRGTSLLGLVVALLWGLIGGDWSLAVVLVPVTAFSMWAMPEHQRRQVFGRQ
jgi:hypothetical protein